MKRRPRAAQGCAAEIGDVPSRLFREQSENDAFRFACVAKAMEGFCNTLLARQADETDGRHRYTTGEGAERFNAQGDTIDRYVLRA